MARKLDVLSPPHLYCVTTLPCKPNTTAKIGVNCFVLLTTLYIKMMCGCSSQVDVFDVSAAILDNIFKTSTPFIDTVINETL